MPTRIVLNETVTARPPVSSRTNANNITNAISPTSGPPTTGRTLLIRGAADVESPPPATRINPEALQTTSNDTTVAAANKDATSNRVVPKAKTRKVVTLRSSLFPAIQVNDTIRRLSREDIRASPRLLGYIFQSLASTIMLISVLKFYFEDEGSNETTPAVWQLFQLEREGDRFGDDLFLTLSGPVFTWKLIGCLVISGFGTAINIMIITAHFDTILFPSFWLKIFRDGSRYEQGLCISMAAFWVGGIHINTSSLSVGEAQANVYFTTWISFFSAIVNCGVWRVSAGRASVAEYVNHHHRETTYNWMWTFLFACTCAGSMSVTYFNRDYVRLFFEGQEIRLSTQQWIMSLSILWGLSVVCFVAIILNHFLKKSCELRVCSGRVVLLGWRQAEGLVAAGVCGFYFWFVYEFTGVNGFINGLSNLYFGSWGAFINSVLLMATWLRENKSLDFVKKEEMEREEQMIRSGVNGQSREAR